MLCYKITARKVLTERETLTPLIQEAVLRRFYPVKGVGYYPVAIIWRSIIFQGSLLQGLASDLMSGLSARSGYYEGYIRGLRRFYYGPDVCNLQEHEKWLGLIYDRDESQSGRGLGYQHGLQGIRPVRYRSVTVFKGNTLRRGLFH